MSDIKSELIAVLSKIWTWLLLIFLGMVGMFSHNIYTAKKLTWKQTIASLGLSFFIGSITSIICYLNDWGKLGVVLVPMLTLLSDRITLAVMAYNWKGFIWDTIDNWRKANNDET